MAPPAAGGQTRVDWAVASAWSQRYVVRRHGAPRYLLCRELVAWHGSADYAGNDPGGAFGQGRVLGDLRFLNDTSCAVEGFGEAKPLQDLPSSRWLWRLCRHSQRERKDFGGTASLQTSLRGPPRNSC